MTRISSGSRKRGRRPPPQGEDFPNHLRIGSHEPRPQDFGRLRKQFLPRLGGEGRGEVGLPLPPPSPDSWRDRASFHPPFWGSWSGRGRCTFHHRRLATAADSPIFCAMNAWPQATQSNRPEETPGQATRPTTRRIPPPCRVPSRGGGRGKRSRSKKEKGRRKTVYCVDLWMAIGLFNGSGIKNPAGKPRLSLRERVVPHLGQAVVGSAATRGREAVNGVKKKCLK